MQTGQRRWLYIIFINLKNKEIIWNNENLVKALEQNGVVVMPTDTLYGIVGRAQNISVIERIYTLRKRNPEKPCIVLIGDINEIKKFSINLSEEQKNVIKNCAVPTSVVLDCPDNSFAYLHRGTKTLAFRIPLNQNLQNLLLKTGPLIAPSANPEGLPPAKNIAEAKKYFGNAVNLYLDGGEISGKASRIIKLHKDSSASIIRE